MKVINKKLTIATKESCKEEEEISPAIDIVYRDSSRSFLLAILSFAFLFFIFFFLAYRSILVQREFYSAKHPISKQLPIETRQNFVVIARSLIKIATHPLRGETVSDATVAALILNRRRGKLAAL